MFDLMSRGFDVRNQNLYNLTSNSQTKPETWKHQILSYKPLLSPTTFWTDPTTGIVFGLPAFAQIPNEKDYFYNTTQNETSKVKLFDCYEDLEPLLTPSDKTVQFPYSFQTQFKKTVLEESVIAEVN